jgi:hypothetical protein
MDQKYWEKYDGLHYVLLCVFAQNEEHTSSLLQRVKCC